MLQQDYLMRMFIDLATAIRRSFERAKGGNDPQGAADMLEAAIANATDMDGALLLRMEPGTFVAMLSLEAPDPALKEYLSRSLLLASRYLDQAGNSELSQLRLAQAQALADSSGIALSDADVSPAELEAFFERTQRR